MRIDKRYQVFVSSTYTDLVDERREIMQALLELDCIPSGMELFQAADDDSWSLIKSVIDDCDYYIVVVAGRYGSQHPETGMSYTEMEYRYAMEKQIPIIAFLHEDLNALSSAVVDSGDLREKLNEFRSLCQEKQVKYWKTPADLGSVVSRSLVRLTKEKPGIGWVRADTLASDEAREQLLRLKEENENLKSELNSAKSVYQGDVSQLVQGSDAFPIKWTGVYQASSDQRWNRNQRIRYTMPGTITLDGLFREVGPAMVDEITETEFRQRVGRYFYSQFANEKVDIKYEPSEGAGEVTLNTKLEDVAASEESFQRLKVQLMALNLIGRGERRRPPSDKASYLRLTDEGERKMMTLTALQKQ